MLHMSYPFNHWCHNTASLIRPRQASSRARHLNESKITNMDHDDERNTEMLQHKKVSEHDSRWRTRRGGERWKRKEVTSMLWFLEVLQLLRALELLVFCMCCIFHIVSSLTIQRDQKNIKPRIKRIFCLDIIYSQAFQQDLFLIHVLFKESWRERERIMNIYPADIL